MPSPTSNSYRFALLGLILCAFFLRVYKLDSQSLWYDEGVTALVAQYDLASLARWTADDIQPPLYYTLVAGWGRLAGWGEWSLRFPSVFFGLLMIPLLTTLTIQWNKSRLAGVLAGLLATFHPLLLYYSQEARMYSLLVALAVGIGYVIACFAGATRNAATPKYSDATNTSLEFRLPATGNGHGRRIWLLWLSYGLLATAALYTHYFAAFFLLAVNIAYFLHLFHLHVVRLYRVHVSHRESQVAQNRQVAIDNILPWFVTNIVVLLLYLPWLGNLFTRLDVDSSYWVGAFKLWDAMTAIAIRFTSGETVLEGEAIRLLWVYGAVTVLALVGQVAGGKSRAVGGVEMSPRSPLSTAQYPLLLLLLPITAVLALASFTPKFNARYVMIALPGLLLLWSAGLAGLLRAFVPIWQRLQRVACNTEPRAVPAIAGLVGTGLLLAGFIQADVNWFFDTAFTKDQWREVAGYVRGHMDENNLVVLVSGHAWPIWRYYVPEIEPVRLPAIEILDVNAVVDLGSSAQILRPALLGKESVWLINWQAEVIDPSDVAGLQLQRAGTEQPISAQFWGLKLRHFTSLDARAISNAPPIQQPFQANFGDNVELLGYSVEQSGDLLLFWRLTHPAQPLPDLYLTAETRTAEGLLYSRIGDRRLSAYDFPTFRWQIGQVVAGRIPVSEWIGAGAPSGNYQLRLGVYDPAGDPAGLDLIGANSERLGKRATVAVSLQQPTGLPADENPTAWHPLEDGLFVRPILVNGHAAAGESILLQILWYSESPRSIETLVIDWNEQGSAVQREGARIAVALSLPAGRAVRTVHQIPVPVGLPPGDYGLELSGERSPTRPVELSVTIAPSSRSFVLPSLNPALSAIFGQQIRLVGLTETDLLPQVAPGVVLPLTFVWQVDTSVQTDYTVTVQWLDGNGHPAGQQDEKLPRGSSTWLPNEVISQIIKLSTPQQPGTYRLIVAVYDSNRSGLPRLRLSSGDDFVELAQIQVQP